MKRAIRLLIAALIAIIGLSLVLQQAAAEPGPQESADGQRRVYLAMITLGAGSTQPDPGNTPNAAINVVARAGLTCGGEETIPVTGARVTVVTDGSSRVAMTDDTGQVVFGAASGPAMIQIEWPAGLFPCPNSRPMVELPNGFGEVEFAAVAAP